MTRVGGNFVHRDEQSVEDSHHIVGLNTCAAGVNKLSQHLQLRVGHVGDNYAGVLLVVPEYVLQEGRHTGEDQPVTPGHAVRPLNESVQELLRPPAALHPVQDCGGVSHHAAVGGRHLKSLIQK